MRPVDQVAAAFATSAAVSLLTVYVAPASTSRTPGSARRRPTALFGTTTAAPLSTIRYRQRIRAPGMASWSAEAKRACSRSIAVRAALPLAPVRPATGGDASVTMTSLLGSPRDAEAARCPAEPQAEARQQSPTAQRSAKARFTMGMTPIRKGGCPAACLYPRQRLAG